MNYKLQPIILEFFGGLKILGFLLTPRYSAISRIQVSRSLTPMTIM